MSIQPSSREGRRFYEFGPFRLDTANRLLMRDGEVVPLKQKAVETLLVLVESRGEVLEKDALMRRLWPDTFVDESNLTQNIYVLRKAFGEANYIETIPRRGYRFNAEVREWEDGAPELIVRESTRSSVFLDEESTTTTQTDTRSVVLAALAVVALLVVAGTWLLRRRVDEPATARPVSPALVRSIAVLPFRSLNADPKDDYIGVGMADSLITRLSVASRLIVRPTSAVLKYAGPTQDAQAAARELEVDSVLDGSIQRQNDRLRITVRLVRTSDGAPLWADQFDERFTDVFKLQDSISEKVTGALAIRLSDDEQKRAGRRPPANPEAYRLYLEGRFFWNKRTEEGLRKSIEDFKSAIAADPTYALPYAGLADAYLQLPAYSPTSSMEIYPQAKAAASKALELDDSLAEAHNSAAGVMSYFEWNWSGAEEEYRKAILLNPNFAAAHHRLGVQLAAMDRPGEALVELERAHELDPLSLIINALLGFTDAQAGQTDRAIAQLRKTIEMDRHFPPPHEFLAYIHLRQGRTDDAAAELMEWRRLCGDDEPTLAALRTAYASSGLPGLFRKRLELLLAREDRSRIQPTDIASLYARLGEKEQAFRWLERAVEQHEGELVWLKTQPDYDALRSDPRFTSLLRRVNLVP